jgi:hypothetical protein
MLAAQLRRVEDELREELGFEVRRQHTDALITEMT